MVCWIFLFKSILIKSKAIARVGGGGRSPVSFPVAEFHRGPYAHVTLREHLTPLTAPAFLKTNVSLAPCALRFSFDFSSYSICLCLLCGSLFPYVSPKGWWNSRLRKTSSPLNPSAPSALSSALRHSFPHACGHLSDLYFQFWLVSSEWQIRLTHWFLRNLQLDTPCTSKTKCFLPLPQGLLSRWSTALDPVVQT